MAAVGGGELAGPEHVDLPQVHGLVAVPGERREDELLHRQREPEGRDDETGQHPTRGQDLPSARAGHRRGVASSRGGEPTLRPAVTDPRPALSFACPRCAASVGERFYGPCAACRADLRRQLAAEPREVGATAFEPAMHVTPNAVALKE